MQSPNKNFEALRAATDRLLHAPPTGRKNAGAVDGLRRVLTQPVDIHNLERTETRLDQGIAIAPAMAIRCLRDSVRTGEFIRGLHAAIQKARQIFRDEVIRVLYPTCGPFGTLALPLTTQFAPEQVQFELLDYHRNSVDTVSGLIDHFGVQQWVSNLQPGNALTHTCARPPHIVVVEAIDRALLNEPQAAITTYWAPQMMPGGIFVPERIAVRLYLKNHPWFSEWLFDFPEKETDLGTVFALTSRTKVDARVHREFRLPSREAMQYSRYNILLGTTVQVFGAHAICEGEAHITHPFLLDEGRVGPGDHLRTFVLDYAPGQLEETVLFTSL